MTPAAELSPWLLDVRSAIFCGQHVLLHGNVADQVRVPGGYTDAQCALRTVLGALGYGHVAIHDLADGFAHPTAADQAVFDALYERATGATPAAAPIHSNGTEREDDARRDRRLGAARAALGEAIRQPRARTVRDPAEALCAARALVAQAEEPVAVVFDRADLLLAGNESSEESRRALAQLSHALRDAAFIGAPPLAKRNAIVLVCATVSAPLAALADAEPSLVRVAITLPGLGERRAFVRAAATQFHTDGQPTASDLDRHADTIARLTGGYRYLELEALRCTSHTARVGLDDPHRLVVRHLHGRRDSPWDETDPQLLLGAADRLRQDVLGQDHVVDAVWRKLIVARHGVGTDRDSARRQRQPRMVLFFVGPTGVGKTELAKGLARLLFADEAALVRFDMSEFQDQASAGRLIGSDPGYVGYEQGGQLVNAVIRQPYSVLLFDEIEKAHPRVLDLFLALLDDGRLTDGQGRTADFRDTVIVFTSNAGAAEIAAAQRAGELPSTHQVRAHFENAITDRLSLPEAQGGINRPELYGRLRSAVLAFDVLRPDVIDSIAAKLVTQWQHNAARQHGIEIDLDPDQAVNCVAAHLADDHLASGARVIGDLVVELLDEPLAWWIAHHQPPKGATVHIAMPGDSQNGERVSLSAQDPQETT